MGAKATFSIMSNTSHEKATIYQADNFCYSRIEVSGLTWRFQKYAQFPNVARLEYTVRGKRKPQVAMMTIPAVVLDGWEHPTPPPKFGPPSKGIQTTRRLLADPEWHKEFDAFLYGYLEGSKARVLLDLRKHDSKKAS